MRMRRRTGGNQDNPVTPHGGLTSAMAGLDGEGVQVGTTLHDLMDTISDAPKEYHKLWAEEQESHQAVSEVREAR